MLGNPYGFSYSDCCESLMTNGTEEDEVTLDCKLVIGHHLGGLSDHEQELCTFLSP